MELMDASGRVGDAHRAGRTEYKVVEEATSY